MAIETCPKCGRTATLNGDVLIFVQEHGRPVRPEDVARHFGISTTRANWALCRLADGGLIVRLSRGVYSGDLELRRLVLDQLDRLAPA
ncbi:hypothetical protein KXD96_22840 [Mycobacterium sp. SMC-2]|uniref:type IV toxin-antitoxin system AbiEi family antitoxin domain-containing protein n=1 Tax=Mycobacterium sp. SMC-2 TaxID=2857058 RepID=UPI0021B4BE4F|nr:type IV toxin-antitoxin system AbiEi family antitoxin domain-containing protein [Mycobacterium sp. SMC-2]UXA05713.1 hypothetical protein KXD96_22840 [Mycobacterium sp. SMC-2]